MQGTVSMRMAAPRAAGPKVVINIKQMEGMRIGKAVAPATAELRCGKPGQTSQRGAMEVRRRAGGAAAAASPPDDGRARSARPGGGGRHFGTTLVPALRAHRPGIAACRRARGPTPSLPQVSCNLKALRDRIGSVKNTKKARLVSGAAQAPARGCV